MSRMLLFNIFNIDIPVKDPGDGHTKPILKEVKTITPSPEKGGLGLGMRLDLQRNGCLCLHGIDPFIPHILNLRIMLLKNHFLFIQRWPPTREHCPFLLPSSSPSLLTFAHLGLPRIASRLADRFEDALLDMLGAPGIDSESISGLVDSRTGSHHLWRGASRLVLIKAGCPSSHLLKSSTGKR